MRQYERLWREIRKYSTSKIIAPPFLHRRIIQAVRKEKTKDLVWKLYVAEQEKKYELKHKIEGKLITFYLIDISPVSLKDL